MKDHSELSLPENLKYSHEHIWVRLENEEVVLGITDFAQDQLGEIAYIDLPRPGKTYAENDVFGSVESVKSVNNLFMPIAGQIIAINEQIQDTPALLNVDPYTNWLVRVVPTKNADLEKLFTADMYLKQL